MKSSLTSRCLGAGQQALSCDLLAHPGVAGGLLTSLVALPAFDLVGRTSTVSNAALAVGGLLGAGALGIAARWLVARAAVRTEQMPVAEARRFGRRVALGSGLGVLACAAMVVATRVEPIKDLPVQTAVCGDLH